MRGRNVGVIIALALMTAVGVVSLIIIFGPSIRYQEDLTSHRIIADAYRKFYRGQGRAPNSLGEIVAAGYLPRSSYIYSSPGFFVRREDVPFELSVYEVVVAEDRQCKVERFCIRRVRGKENGFPEVHSEVKMDSLYPTGKAQAL